MSNSTASTNLYDAIVIGAGLSGLQAALSLQTAGLTVCVLEAIDRVGGKTLSVQSSAKGFNDLGAAWINDTSQSEMYKLYQKYGIDSEVQYVKGDNVYRLVSGKVEKVPFGVIPEGGETVEKVIQKCEATTNEVGLKDPRDSEQARELDQITFKQFCARMFSSEEEIFVAGVFSTAVSEALLGVGADELSALCMIQYFASGTGIVKLLSDLKDGAQYLRARPGTQTVSKNMAAELGPDAVRLGMPVTSIDQSSPEGHCTVRTATDVFAARRVVVSLPTTLYHSINFAPPLPDSKQSLSESTIMGAYAKVIFVFSEPWWREDGLTGTLEDETQSGPISFTRDTSIPADDQWSITCFIVGEKARESSKLSPEERKEHAWKQFEETFGQVYRKPIPKPINTLERNWVTQPFFLGAPCAVMPPGVLTKTGSALKEAFGNVHFVGTETSDVWRGYMEGAVRSGKRGAEEVVKALTESC